MLRAVLKFQNGTISVIIWIPLLYIQGYEKNQKGDVPTSNKRNRHSPKTLKSQYGEFQIDVPRDRKGEFEPKFIPKYQRDISAFAALPQPDSNVIINIVIPQHLIVVLHPCIIFFYHI